MALVGIAAWRARRPALVCLAALVLASALAAAAERGLARPDAARLRGAAVVLLTDPSPVGPGRTAVARLGRRHVQLLAFGRAGRSLGRRLAGDVVVVDGRLSAVRGPRAAALRARHVAARIDVEIVTDWRPGNVLAEAANRIRRTLERGASVLPPTERSLYLGLVIGDDRDEPPAIVNAFRASGLAHLTAVSGENVAFVLVCLAPLLRRLPLRGRWLATLAVVAWFAVLTRFEPSVLRAATMAALAATTTYLDRSVSGVRLLGLAVTIGILADPFLVRSVGWWLSVGATAGLVTLAGPIARLLPGPRWLAEPLGLTIAAQIGVAPVTIVVFGPLPLASVPSNLLAAPAAGPLMVWGLPMGLLAGLLPRLGPLVHLPSLVLVRWIALVARIGERLPVGRVGPRAMVTVAVAVAGLVVVGVVIRRRGRHGLGVGPGPAGVPSPPGRPARRVSSALVSPPPRPTAPTAPTASTGPTAPTTPTGPLTRAGPTGPTAPTGPMTRAGRTGPTGPMTRVRR